MVSVEHNMGADRRIIDATPRIRGLDEARTSGREREDRQHVLVAVGAKCPLFAHLRRLRRRLESTDSVL
jgi:hypothetical protein